MLMLPGGAASAGVYSSSSEPQPAQLWVLQLYSPTAYNLQATSLQTFNLQRYSVPLSANCILFFCLLFFCFEIQNIISETYFGSVGTTLPQFHNANAQRRNPNSSILFSLLNIIFDHLINCCVSVTCNL